MRITRRRLLTAIGGGAAALAALGCGPGTTDDPPSAYPMPIEYKVAKADKRMRQPYLDEASKQISVQRFQGALYDHNSNMIDYTNPDCPPAKRCTTLMSVYTDTTISAPAAQSSTSERLTELLNNCSVTSKIYVAKHAFDLQENEFQSWFFDHEALHVRDEHEGFAIGGYMIPTFCSSQVPLVLDPVRRYIKGVRAYANQLTNADARAIGSRMRQAMQSNLDYFWKKARAESSIELNDLLEQLRADLEKQGIVL